MKSAFWIRSMLIGVAVVLGAVEARASDPVGVYCIVEKVVFEPSEANATRVQVWGAFALSDGRSGEGYLPAQYGYMYFSIATVLEQAGRAEWMDLKKVAATGDVIAFGGRYLANGRIRKAADKPGAPDAYPIHRGLTRLAGNAPNSPVNGGFETIVARLKEALKSKQGGTK